MGVGHKDLTFEGCLEKESRLVSFLAFILKKNLDWLILHYEFQLLEFVSLTQASCFHKIMTSYLVRFYRTSCLSSIKLETVLCNTVTSINPYGTIGKVKVKLWSFVLLEISLTFQERQDQG